MKATDMKMIMPELTMDASTATRKPKSSKEDRAEVWQKKTQMIDLLTWF